MKVCHLTSVHKRYDTRIFVKQCTSIANAGFESYLVVADGKGDEELSGVKIIDVGDKQTRLKRIIFTTNKVFEKAKEIDAEIYHLHDPELIPIGVKLLKRGKKVIYDAHEDFAKQLFYKPYLKGWQKNILSKITNYFEPKIIGNFSAVVTATPYIRDKFLKFNSNTIDVNNYPKLQEFESSKQNQSLADRRFVCYVGGLTKVRGIYEVVEAQKYITSDARIQIAGDFFEEEFKNEVQSLKEWNDVTHHGFIGRDEVVDVLNSSIAGLVTLHPIVNYLDALPVKMFEYMASGIPVISSNIKLWQSIVESNQCGICVDPLSPKQIGEAINQLVNNPDEAQRMGQNGLNAVRTKYNWGIEERKLITLYQNLLK